MVDLIPSGSFTVQGANIEQILDNAFNSLAGLVGERDFTITAMRLSPVARTSPSFRVVLWEGDVEFFISTIHTEVVE
jgi:hypothetical protein